MAARFKREAIPVSTPSFQTLVERFNSGLKSKKEITRRVKAGPPNKPSKDVLDAYNRLEAIAQEMEWVS